MYSLANSSAVRPRVSPGAVGVGREGDAAEFGEHDGLVGVRSLEQRSRPAGAFAFEQARRFVAAVTPCDALRLVVVIVDADDVRGYALPAVVANHGTRRIHGLGEVIKCLHVVALRGAVGKVGTPHDSLNGTHATIHG